MMRKVCFNHSNILKLLVFIAGIATFFYVEAQMSMVYTTQQCNSCLSEGHVSCRTSTNISQGICCNPNGIDIEQCSAHADVNFDYCSSDVTNPTTEPYACPYQQASCFWQPCKGMVFDVETDCTFNNSAIVRACKYADEQEHFEYPCEKG